jgi:hypothetical protein
MVTTKKLSRNDRADLIVCIESAVELQGQIADLEEMLKARKAAIKDLLTRHQMDRFLTDKGCEAVLAEVQRYSFDLQKLRKVFNDDELDAFCPRRPDTAKLRKLIDSEFPAADAVKLAAKISKSSRLNCTAPTAAGTDYELTDAGAQAEAAAKPRRGRKAKAKAGKGAA